jgi:hypothetical protein
MMAINNDVVVACCCNAHRVNTMTVSEAFLNTQRKNIP